MKKFDYVIQDELGIHARPAAMLVQEAKKYESKVVIACNGKESEITKLFAVMVLGVKQGDTITVTAEGSDEEQASNAIKEFLEKNL